MKNLWLSLLLLVSGPAAAEPWVDQLLNSRMDVCCSNSDGRRLDDPEWDILGKVSDLWSGYRVIDAGTIWEVPLAAVVTMRNQDGIARVWWNPIIENNKVIGKSIRCFLPGAAG